MLRFIVKLVDTPNTMYAESVVRFYTFIDPKKLEEFLRNKSAQVIGVELIEGV
ncbi:MAG: hypothetical protein WC175_01205 [Candidatus Dojkabacteria bacterium]